MAEKYFPFNSVSGDREYSAVDFAAYFGDIISSGVSANGDNLPVTSAGGLNLSVGPGFAWIEGHLYENTATKTLSLETGGSLPRIDRVVARLDVAERKIEAVILKGTPASSPAAPALTRNADYWEIGLANIAVAASAISVTDSNITDTRTDVDVCGVVRCAVDNLDVGAFMKNCEADFRAWLANLQYVLDGDVAAHLQNEIDRLRQDLDDGKYSTPSIVNITTVPGASIVITKGGKTVEGKADGKGAAQIEPDELGTWSVKITTANATYTDTIAVDFVGIYNLALPTLEAMAWADINIVGQAGAAASVFKRGDKKNITINGETITIRLEDFSHDDLASGGKAPMTFMMENLLAGTNNMNSTNTNVGSWSASAMRSRMATFLNQLPADLRAVIKPVIKKTTAGNQTTTIQTTTDSLWLPSPKEVGLHTTETGYKDEGTQYPLFTDNASRIKKLSNGTGSAYYWWTRSPNAGNSSSFRCVASDGSSNYYNASNTSGVCLGLCDVRRKPLRRGYVKQSNSHTWERN